VIANTTKHSASGLYGENKTMKNHVNTPKKISSQLLKIHQFFWSKASENKMQIIWFDREADALSSCVKMRNL
jgi:hypothetical protein